MLGQKIDWDAFKEAFSGCYSEEFGTPAKAIRLMVGLHYLNRAKRDSQKSGRHRLPRDK
jgi:IS5 family transposase